MALPSPQFDARTSAATALHRAADLLNSRATSIEDLTAATALIDEANDLLAKGVAKTEEDRGLEFASQMVVPMGARPIEDGEKFEAFLASPYSGAHNAMRPSSVTYQRVGEELHASVLIGPALEGAPGRAHGGLTAAVFDDAMGAMQRMTGLSGYTRTLEVTLDGKTLATARGIFTRLSPEQFFVQ